jgi:hypothetical protein
MREMIFGEASAFERLLRVLGRINAEVKLPVTRVFG